MFLNGKDWWRKRTFSCYFASSMLWLLQKKGALWLATGRNLFWYRAPAPIHSQPSRQDCAFGEFKRVIFHENLLFMVATQPQGEKKNFGLIDLQVVSFLINMRKALIAFLDPNSLLLFFEGKRKSKNLFLKINVSRFACKVVKWNFWAIA